MTQDLERQLSEHYRRLDPAMAPLALSERLDEVAASTEAASPRRRAAMALAAVFTVSLLGIALIAAFVGTSLDRGRPGVGGRPLPTPVLDEPVLSAGAAAAWLSKGGGPFIVSGWLTYDGSGRCTSDAAPDAFDDRCPAGWYVVDRDPYGPGAPATRLRLALANQVGTAITNTEVLLRVRPQDRPGPCPATRHGCEPLLAVTGVLWADRLAVHVDNRWTRAVTVAIAAGGSPADGSQTQVTLAPNASIDLTAAMTERWTVEVDGQVAIDSLAGSPAGPILVTIDASGAVRAEPLVP